MCPLNGCTQPTRGSPSVFGLVRGKFILDDKKYTNLNDELYSSPDIISVSE